MRFLPMASSWRPISKANSACGKSLQESCSGNESSRKGSMLKQSPFLPIATALLRPYSSETRTATRSCTVRLWETRTGKLLRTWKGDPGKKRIHRLVFSPDGNRLIAESYEDQHEGAFAIESDHGKGNALGEADGIVCSPTGTIVATYKYQDGICLWDMATGKITSSLPNSGHSGQDRPLVFSPDGKIWRVRRKKRHCLLGRGHGKSTAPLSEFQTGVAAPWPFRRMARFWRVWRSGFELLGGGYREEVAATTGIRRFYKYCSVHSGREIIGIR